MGPSAAVSVLHQPDSELKRPGVISVKWFKRNPTQSNWIQHLNEEVRSNTTLGNIQASDKMKNITIWSMILKMVSGDWTRHKVNSSGITCEKWFESNSKPLKGSAKCCCVLTSLFLIQDFEVPPPSSLFSWIYNIEKTSSLSNISKTQIETLRFCQAFLCTNAIDIRISGFVSFHFLISN